MNAISRTITRLAVATAGVSTVLALTASPAGAAGAKISLTNAVITGVTAEATASLQGFTTWDGKDETLLLVAVNTYRGVTNVGNDG